MRWLEDERIDKGGTGPGEAAPPAARREWRVELTPAFAAQRDPSLHGDCGMFTCAAADWLVAAAINSSSDSSGASSGAWSILPCPSAQGSSDGDARQLRSADMPAARLSMARILQDHCLRLSDGRRDGSTDPLSDRSSNN